FSKNAGGVTAPQKWPQRYMRLPFVLLWLVTVILYGPACNRSDGGSGSVNTNNWHLASDPVDMTGLFQTFASADPTLRLYVEETAALVRAHANSDAIEELQKLMKNPKLTTDQRRVVEEMIAKIQQAPVAGK